MKREFPAESLPAPSTPRQARSLSVTVTLGRGQRYTLRALRSDDGEALSEYFDSLSVGTRSLYGPHPFDRDTALRLAAEQRDDILRFIAVEEHPGPTETGRGVAAADDGPSAAGAGGHARIVAYWILSLSVSPWDAERYARRLTGASSPSGAGNPELQSLPSEESCSIAPSVRDDLQSRGLGSAMMEFVTAVARALGKKRMILQGGVQAKNTLARHFYEKHGFLRAGEFQSTIDNIDMVLPL